MKVAADLNSLVISCKTQQYFFLLDIYGSTVGLNFMDSIS